MVNEDPELNTDPENLLGRSSYDECVTWIAEKFDEAAERLPETRPNNRLGLATKVAAQSIKARMLLYAASPQFNGNEMYADFTRSEERRVGKECGYQRKQYK